jgi:spermidine synthase
MLIVAFLILGFGGIVAQTLLLRELLVLFSGNELSLGLIIGSWIVSEALGAL